MRARGCVHDGLLRAHATHHGLVGALQRLRKCGEPRVGRPGVGWSLRNGDGVPGFQFQACRLSMCCQCILPFVLYGVIASITFCCAVSVCCVPAPAWRPLARRAAVASWRTGHRGRGAGASTRLETTHTQRRSARDLSHGQHRWKEASTGDLSPPHPGRASNVEANPPPSTRILTPASALARPLSLCPQTKRPSSHLGVRVPVPARP